MHIISKKHPWLGLPFRLSLGGTVMLLCSLLWGCLVAKKYVPPSIKEQAVYRQMPEGSDSASLALLPWKTFFKDSLLQRYIQDAIEHNYDLRIALQDLAMATSQMKQAKLIALPELKGSMTATASTFGHATQFGRVFNNMTTYDLSVGLSWEIDIWGKLRSSKRADIANFLASGFSTKAVTTQIVANVATLYYQLLSLDEKLRIAQVALQNRKANEEVTEALYQAGNVTQLGLQQVRSQRYSAELTIQDIRYALKTTEHALSILLGKPPQAIQRGNSLPTQGIAEIRVGVPAQLLSRRPDLMMAEQQFRKAFELSNVARANFYPSLNITGLLGSQALAIEKWFSPQSILANIAGGLTQPIFQRRRIKTAYEVAQANQAKSLLQFEQTFLKAGQEVSDGIAQYENEQQKILIREKQITDLKNAELSSDELFKSGYINYLEVITAKDASLNAQLLQVESQFQLCKTTIYLYRALGGGYQ